VFTAKAEPHITNPILRISASRNFALKDILSIDSTGNFHLNAPVDNDGVHSKASYLGATFSLVLFATFFSVVSKKYHLLLLAIAISKSSS
jgi:hypothetical protein